ncbi:MAG: lytic murein transglycosylase [Alphaproteobacteria bacterium]|nr:lytic murein transglycosylase [Alphaproteobacteria bacterium]MBN2675464.1 lytic murein transglycosylase [Alphaproteobacteria bacterium]
MKNFLISCFSVLFLLPSICFADEGSFDLDRWNSILNDIQSRAVEMKISNHTINEVIQPSVFIPSIVNSDKNQSEFKLTLDQYLNNVVNQKRIISGKKMRRKYPTLLSKVDKKYGVPPHIIMAFWGLESNYGEYKAKYKLSDAFLTLIYDGRRETFFTNQLFAMMKSADKDKLEVSEIYGSWAGAMGHFQFIPTTLEQYGMDGNNDGRIDIIHSVGDAMFSAGNYLSKLGWNKHEKIIREVKLPADFDTSLLEGKVQKPLTEWAAMGITNPDGSEIPKAEMIAGLVADTSVPEISRAFLTYPNFYRIKKWNNSNWYAIAIGLLSEKLK